MSRGAPKLPDLNARQDDGSFICHRMPSPPWDRICVEEMLHHMAVLRLDPDRTNYLSQEPSVVVSIACPVMPEIFDYIDFSSNQDWLGRRMFELLADEKSDTIADVFSSILKLKRQSEKPPSRAYWAFLAYITFYTERGAEPSKDALRKYILANKEKYKDCPAEGDGKGWTRLWEGSGLTQLRQR